MFPERALRTGISVKGFIMKKDVVAHGCVEFQVPQLPIMVAVSVGSDKKGSVSLAAMLGPVQAQIMAGYGQHGFSGGFGMEINENAVVR